MINTTSCVFITRERPTASSGRPRSRPSGGALAHPPRPRPHRTAQQNENWVLRHLPRKPWDDSQPAGTALPAPPRRILRWASAFALEWTGFLSPLECVALIVREGKCSTGSNANSDKPRTVWLLASHSIPLNVLLSLTKKPPPPPHRAVTTSAL